MEQFLIQILLVLLKVSEIPGPLLFKILRMLLPPSEDCVPKKVTGSVLLECTAGLGLTPPKYWPLNQYFWARTFFFADFAMKIIFFVFTQKFAHFAMKTFFFTLRPRIRGVSRIFCNEDLFYGLHSRILGKKFWGYPKNCFCPLPQSHSGAGPAQHLHFFFEKK